MATSGMHPTHPEEILCDELLMESNISPAALARALRVSAPTVSDIVHEQRGISADMTTRLGRYFDTSAQFWMNLQSEYSLAIAHVTNDEQIEHEIEPLLAHGQR